MADVNRGNRPLSPFMLGKYYRPQLNSVTSILTRITGNAMIVAALMIAWWLLAAATSEAAFNRADWFVTSFIGDLIMFFSVLGLWYHSLAGIRHLIWDAGYGLEVEQSEFMGWIMIFGSLALTVLTIIIAVALFIYMPISLTHSLIRSVVKIYCTYTEPHFCT